jgi:hypothetical protein
MGDYNIDNTLSANIYKVLACLFNTSYTHISWEIRSSLEYPKDLNMAETFQYLSIYTTFLTSIKSGLQAIYNEGQTVKSQLKET